jgi:hypothetical protein
MKWTTTTQTRFTVNGQTYNSIDEMPPDVRQKFQDAMSKLADRDGNGIPDIMEGKGDPNAIGTSVRTTQSFIVGARDAQILRDLPPDASMRVMSKMHGTLGENSPGGITIRLTGPALLLLTIVVAVAVVLIIWALQRR